MGAHKHSVGFVGADPRGGGVRRGARAGEPGGGRRQRRRARAGRVGARQRGRRLAALPGHRARRRHPAAATRVTIPIFFALTNFF